MAAILGLKLNRPTLIEPAAPSTRYELTPGKLVHLDIKPLGRILRVGKRFDRAHRPPVRAGSGVRPRRGG